jgi:hypothetical protein
VAEAAKDGTGRPRWKSWTRGWLWVFVVLLLGLLVAFSVDDRFAVWLLALPGVLAIGFGAFELLAPRKFLAWREADTPTGGWEREALEGFDDALGVARTENGEFTDSTVRRVRFIGAGVAAFGVLTILGVIAVDRAGYLQ